MRSTKFLRAAALLATATATTTGLATGASGPVTAAAAAPRPSDPVRPEGAAYGVAATGPVTLPATPAVASRGAEVRKSLARETRSRLFSAAAMDTTATARHARSTVKDLKVPGAAFSADAVSARCRGGRGQARLANAVVSGKRLGVRPRANSVVPVNIPGVGTAKVTLNKQRRLPDGRLAVTAVEAAVPMKKLGTETISTAAVTCGRATHKRGIPGSPAVPGTPAKPGAPGAPGGPAGPGTPGGSGGSMAPGGTPAAPPARAPKPTPVDGDLPVAG
ncbi:choice-of-anchor P family protein [Spirillospora sp. CA-255316]